MNALDIVKKYYEAFNRQDWEGMLALVHPDIRHEPNQGEPRLGKDKFREFMSQMDVSYAEQLTKMVFMTQPDGNQVAVEFVVQGTYKQAEEGLPAAHGQRYELPAAAFLDVTDGLISRVTTYYNLPLWIRLVSE
jgi:steroid delta-isomerase-like uncharacterized protein